MSLYFKTIKQLILLFILCTILSIPSFIFFWTGNSETQKNWLDSKTLFSTFTLGNLGQSSTGCGQANFISLTESTLTTSTTNSTTLTPLRAGSIEITVNCPYGAIDDIGLVQISNPQESDCNDFVDEKYLESSNNCNLVANFVDDFADCKD